MSVKMRKTIISAMYDKVCLLSIKSLTETNSGKLITIISGDVFNVERAICMLPILPATPFVTFLCLFYIAWGSGIEFACYTFIIWILVLVAQFSINLINNKIKAKEMVLSDQRMKMINDLVTGIRTIKSYAWENHYLNKIKEIRAK